MPASIARSKAGGVSPARRDYAFESGVFAVFSLVPLLLTSAHHPGLTGLSVFSWAVLGIAGAASLYASLVWTRQPGAARVCATGALSCAPILALPALLRSPAAALGGVVGVIGGATLIWNLGGLWPRRRLPDAIETRASRARGALLTAFAMWLLTDLSGARDDTAIAVAILPALGLSGLLALRWSAAARRRHPARAGLMCAFAALPGVSVLVSGGDLPATAICAAIAVVAMVVMLPASSATPWRGLEWGGALVSHPERLFVGTFALMSLIGAMLLGLPHSIVAGERLDLLDAAFTSVSAVCVTGLIVRDTPTVFSPFGQAVILVLIQVGGLGIMTFSTAVWRVFGHRMSLRYEGAVASLISTRDRGRLFGSARDILGLTLGAEAAGALVLTGAFLAHGEGFAAALWRAVFTAVSAFCNAGFALQTDSLIPYQGDPLVLHTVALLIIAGGLSPLAVFAIPALLGRSRAPVSAQAKLCLTVSALLLLGGFAFFLAFEWNDALSGLSPWQRVHNAWFQSVTLRTAGFNSVDLTPLTSASVVLMMIWMFIGGAPGGTAGGIKITTLAVLALSVAQTVRGRATLSAFHRRLSDATRQRSAVIVTLAAAVVVAVTVALLVTQDLGARATTFEAVSALGTVGLSLGATSALDEIGKWVIMLAMFVGRVGGLTALMILSQRRPVATWDQPEETIDVG